MACAVFDFTDFVRVPKRGYTYRSKPNVLQLLRIAGQINCDDAATVMPYGLRIDRSIILAQDEARKVVDHGWPGRNGGMFAFALPR